MARGWESKSVEDQMAQAATHQPQADAAASGFVTEDQRRAADQVRTVKERQKQALVLQRENILSQRTSSPARRSALEAALAHVEAQLEAMN
jgi:hypothetical protein